jgi:hypothetical protein
MSLVYPPPGGPPTHSCLRCGTSLPLTVVTCMNCGTYNPVVLPGGSGAQTSYSGGQYPGLQWGQAPVSPSQSNQWGQPPMYPQNNPFGTPYIPQEASSPNNIYGIPGQGQQSNVNNSYGMPQQNAYYSSPPAIYEGYSSGSLDSYASTGYDRPPKKKRGPKVALIISIILLITILVGGAFAGYVFYQSHTQNSNVTVTLTKVSTPAVAPLFKDSFANNKTGWDLTSMPGKFSARVGGGSMVLEDDDNKFLTEILPGMRFTDFRLDVDAILTRGDPNNGYGVFIRAGLSQDGQLGTYYRVELYGDGNFAIFKGTLNTNGQSKSTQVQDFPVNDAIAKVGHVNHITIIAKGSAMTLIVNGQIVFTYTDDNYKSGSVALFVSNLPSVAPGAQATFTNLAIFPSS